MVNFCVGAVICVVNKSFGLELLVNCWATIAEIARYFEMRTEPDPSAVSCLGLEFANWTQSIELVKLVLLIFVHRSHCLSFLLPKNPFNFSLVKLMSCAADDFLNSTLPQFTGSSLSRFLAGKGICSDMPNQMVSNFFPIGVSSITSLYMKIWNAGASILHCKCSPQTFNMRLGFTWMKKCKICLGCMNFRIGKSHIEFYNKIKICERRAWAGRENATQSFVGSTRTKRLI